MSSLTGTVSAGAVILNDWAITMEEIPGGHRLTARRGSEVQSMDIMDGTGSGAGGAVTINGQRPDENGNFIINTVSDVEVAQLSAALT